MLLKNKVAVIYGAGGAVGGAVARAFAREGARVFLTGRNLSNVDGVAKEIVGAHGRAESAQVDALDEKAIEDHLSSVVRNAGRIDISFNAITPVPQPGVQGIPIAKLPVDSFTAPITAYTRSHFLTARAAARRMAEKGSCTKTRRLTRPTSKPLYPSGCTIVAQLLPNRGRLHRSRASHPNVTY